MKNYEIHQYALTYPAMTEAELVALSEDIKLRGLQRPIVLYEGKVLDGRCRLEACKRAGVEPEFVTYDGDDPLGQVNSLNLNRDMTSGQRALVAARQWGLDGHNEGSGRRSKEKSQSATLSVRDLSRRFRASDNSIKQARDLLTGAEDLAAQVDACALSLAAAFDQLQARRRETAQKARDAAKVAEFREAVSNGDMSYEEALQKAMDDERDQIEIRKSRADARREHLKGIVAAVTFIEMFMDHKTEENAAWAWEDGPGQFEHGLDV